MGAGIDVADVFDSNVVFEREVVNVEVPQKVSGRDFHKIGIQFSGNLGRAAACVEFEGFQIGISDVRGEFVKSVVGFG